MGYSDNNIGAILKDQRVKFGDSLQDPAQPTRIGKSSLESIEINQFTDLPGQDYVVGFVRVYARSLGVDSKALLTQIEETWLNDRPLPLKLISVAKHQPR